MNRLVRRSLLALVAFLLTVGVGRRAHAQTDIIVIEDAYPEVTFDFPLGIRFPDDGENKVYVAELAGLVKVMDNDPAVSGATVFLDLTERIDTVPAGKFYGVEFHPNYAENGYFFARYKTMNPERTVLSRFSRSTSDPLVADPESEVVLLDILTPGNSNDHHGGDIAFGPDGYLYVPLGDGGTQFDVAGNAQDRTKLLGKVLRLDVDNPAGELNYGIPEDNPFVGNSQGWREEIFAYGFRNPWRMTIDRMTGDVWLGDVGESTWEEVNWVESGKNYGWPIMEGEECAPWTEEKCDQSGLTLPVWAYPHDVGVSITGGYVYRGDKIPALYGKYMYMDFGQNQHLYAVERNNPVESLLVRTFSISVATFGEDLDGELYIAYFFGGRIIKILPGAGATGVGDDAPNLTTFNFSVFPNPTAGSSNLTFFSEAGAVRATMYDVLGREVGVVFDEVVGPGTSRTVTVHTDRLPTGIYLLRVESRGEVGTKRIVVSR